MKRARAVSGLSEKVQTVWLSRKCRPGTVLVLLSVMLIVSSIQAVSFLRLARRTLSNGLTCEPSSSFKLTRSAWPRHAGSGPADW